MLSKNESSAQRFLVICSHCDMMHGKCEKVMMGTIFVSLVLNLGNLQPSEKFFHWSTVL